MNDEEKFLEWLDVFTFAIGNDRYNLFQGGWSFVAMATSTEFVNLPKLAEDLSGGDMEAFEAREQIDISDIALATHKDPSKAMTELIDKLRSQWVEIEASQAYLKGRPPLTLREELIRIEAEKESKE